MTDETQFNSIVSGFVEDERDYSGAYLRIQQAEIFKILKSLTAALVLTCIIPVIAVVWVTAWRYVF